MRRTLGIYDSGRLDEGRTASAHSTLRRLAEWAEAADRQGYERFWVAEHHAPEAAETTPEMVLPFIGARTRGIRLGTGCTLVAYYSPLKVVKNLRTLEALFPGRVDLGMARGPGAEAPIVQALTGFPDGRSATECFARKARDVVDLLTSASAARGSAALLAGTALPDVWIGGLSPANLTLAAESGLRFAWPYFMTFMMPTFDPPSEAEQIRTHYAARFRPGPWGSAPHHCLAASVLCARTAEEAKRLDREATRLWGARNSVVGTPVECAEALGRLSDLYGTDEFVIPTFCPDFQKKIRSYELLAEAAGLRPRAPALDAAPPSPRARAAQKTPAAGRARGGRA